jgi:putative tryptophan/tyrosine transport system substrate-binding protein
MNHYGRSDRVRRREFIALLGGAAAWPLGARAQQARMPVIGFLSSLSVPVSSKRISSFGEGLGETDYIVAATSRSKRTWQKGNMIDCPH